MTMTKHQLYSLLTARGCQEVTIKGVKGVLSSVEREDGSGSSFNVKLLTQNGPVLVYVRTLD